MKASTLWLSSEETLNQFEVTPGVATTPVCLLMSNNILLLPPCQNHLTPGQRPAFVLSS
jgi:hypothetical protein